MRDTITTRAYNVRFDPVPEEKRPVRDKLPEALRNCYDEIMKHGGGDFVLFDGEKLVMSGSLQQLAKGANGDKSITMKTTPFDVYNGNAVEMFKKLSSPAKGGIVEAAIVGGGHSYRLVVMSTRESVATVTASNRRARNNEMSL